METSDIQGLAFIYLIFLVNFFKKFSSLFIELSPEQSLGHSFHDIWIGQEGIIRFDQPRGSCGEAGLEVQILETILKWLHTKELLGNDVIQWAGKTICVTKVYGKMAVHMCDLI